MTITALAASRASTTQPSRRSTSPSRGSSSSGSGIGAAYLPPAGSSAGGAAFGHKAVAAEHRGAGESVSRMHATSPRPRVVAVCVEEALYDMNGSRPDAFLPRDADTGDQLRIIHGP